MGVFDVMSRVSISKSNCRDLLSSSSNKPPHRPPWCSLSQALLLFLSDQQVYIQKLTSCQQQKNESFYVVLVEPSWRNQQASSSAAAACLAQQWLTVKSFGESYSVLADVFSTTSWRFALLICIGDEQTKQSIFRRCRPRLDEVIP